jgi:uncharacterized protein
VSQAVALFAKAPVSGEVKTRLAPALGPGGAAELYRCFLLDAVELAKRVPGGDVFIFGAPQAKLPVLRELLGSSIPLLPQGDGDLGSRMHRASCALFARGYTSVVITGSDLPTMPLGRLIAAFVALDRKPVVLGPSLDGGYYLIGLRAPSPGLFEEIEWSSRQVLDQTLDRMDKLSLPMECLEPWYDVDTPDDLDLLVSHLRLLSTAGTCDLPYHTVNWLRQSGRLVCRSQ